MPSISRCSWMNATEEERGAESRDPRPEAADGRRQTSDLRLSTSDAMPSRPEILGESTTPPISDVATNAITSA